MGSNQQVLLARPDLLRVGAVFSSFIVLASILLLHFRLNLLPFVPHSGAFRSDEHIVSNCSSRSHYQIDSRRQPHAFVSPWRGTRSAMAGEQEQE